MNRRTRAYSMGLRAARAAETRARIRSAAIELHAERLWDGFTLNEVARRAGTTAQTVLRIFGTKDALSVLAVEAAAQRPRAHPVPGDVAAAVRALYDDYERIGDRVIHYLAEERRTPGLAAQVELGRRAHRDWIAAAFSPQLAACRPQRRARLLTGLLVATDVYVWKLLRKDLHVARAQAEELVRTMISAVVEREGDGAVPVGVLGRRRKPSAEPRHRASADGTRP